MTLKHLLNCTPWWGECTPIKKVNFCTKFANFNCKPGTFAKTDQKYKDEKIKRIFFFVVTPMTFKFTWRGDIFCSLKF